MTGIIIWPCLTLGVYIVQSFKFLINFHTFLIVPIKGFTQVEISELRIFRLLYDTVVMQSDGNNFKIATFREGLTSELMISS